MTIAQCSSNQQGKAMGSQKLTLRIKTQRFRFIPCYTALSLRCHKLWQSRLVSQALVSKTLVLQALLFGKVVLCFCLGGTAAHAAIVRPLNDHTIIEIPISQHDLTRIAVKDDRILNVFGTTGEYVLESDEEQGQIFIRPIAHNSKPLHLTLTTEKGHTQDLRLLPKNQAPETLLLEEEEEDIKNGKFKGKKSKGNLLKERPPLMRGEVEDLLTACAQERIPLGYRQVPLELTTLSQTSQKTSYLLVRELQGEHLKGLTYEIKNTTKARRIFSEPEFIKTCSLPSDEIIAILMPKKILNPHEGGQIYVVTRAN